MGVSALAGISYGEQDLVANDATVFSNKSAAAFAPVGVSMTWPRVGSDNSTRAVRGLFISILDLGNLIDDSEGAVDAEGTEIAGEVDASFSDVFAPGVYFTYAPRKVGPMVFGVGTSYGSAGTKAATLPNGTPFEVEREWTWRVFAAVDILMFPFRSR